MKPRRGGNPDAQKKARDFFENVNTKDGYTDRIHLHSGDTAKKVRPVLSESEGGERRLSTADVDRFMNKHIQEGEEIGTSPAYAVNIEGIDDETHKELGPAWWRSQYKVGGTNMSLDSLILHFKAGRYSTSDSAAREVKLYVERLNSTFDEIPDSENLKAQVKNELWSELRAKLHKEKPAEFDTKQKQLYDALGLSEDRRQDIGYTGFGLNTDMPDTEVNLEALAKMDPKRRNTELERAREIVKEKIKKIDEAFPILEQAAKMKMPKLFRKQRARNARYELIGKAMSVFEEAVKSSDQYKPSRFTQTTDKILFDHDLPEGEKRTDDQKIKAFKKYFEDVKRKFTSYKEWLMHIEQGWEQITAARDTMEVTGKDLSQIELDQYKLQLIEQE